MTLIHDGREKCQTRSTQSQRLQREDRLPHAYKDVDLSAQEAKTTGRLQAQQTVPTSSVPPTDPTLTLPAYLPISTHHDTPLDPTHGTAGALLFLGLFLGSQASPSAGQSAVVARAVDVSNITRFELAITGRFKSTDISEAQYSHTLVAGLITANTAIAAGIATCIATTAALGTWGCIGIGAAALALNYLTVWLLGTTSVVKRSGTVFDDVTVRVHAEWEPVDRCDTACVFVANVPAYTWTPFGDTTYADGTVVQIHSLHDGVEGGVRGLRAIVPSQATGEASSTAARRQVETDYNSVTSQYNFYQEDATARDDLVDDYGGSDSNLANEIGAAMSEYAADWDGVVMCGNYEDPDGLATAGLWTFDDDDRYYGLRSDTVESDLDACVDT